MNNNQEVFFSNIREHILKNLNEATYSIKVAVAWITDKKILNAILQLAKKNIVVDIIIFDDRINKKEYFEELHTNGVKIYLSKKMMHNKFCIIDDEIIINGSYNWTYNAKSNEENIQISKNDYDLIRKFSEQFYKLKKNCRSIDYFFQSIEDSFKIYFEEKSLGIYPCCIIDQEAISFNEESELKCDPYYLILDREQEIHVLKYRYNKEKKISTKTLPIENYSHLVFTDILNYDITTCEN
jgi:hypothetical protein